jgi:hypothetical protein
MKAEDIKPKVHFIDVEGYLDIQEEDQDGNRWSKKMTRDEYWKQRNQVSDYENEILGIKPALVRKGSEIMESFLKKIEAIQKGDLLPRVVFETHVNQDGTLQKVYVPKIQ